MGDEQDKAERREYWSASHGKFYHEAMARDLIDIRCARFIDGMPCSWDAYEGRFRIGHDAWAADMVDLTSGTTTAHRKEVASYLHLVAPRFEQGDAHLIACANGVVDPWCEGFEELDADGYSPGFTLNSPEQNIPNVLPVEWDPTAYDEATDEALDAFSCGDPLTRANLEEVLAACVYRGRYELQNMAVLVGEGGNGKSVFLHMLEGLLGPENYAAIDLRDVGRRFMQAPLVGKLANIGDDIADGIVDAGPLSVVKKIVTGDSLTIEEKFGHPYTVRPYATLVFAANRFPRLADYSGGMLDRIFAIRFDADFRHDGARRVTDISERLATERSRQYLLNLALRRLPALVRRGGFTPTPYSEAMRETVRLTNDSVGFWIDNEGVRPSHVDGRAVGEIYAMYKDFCHGAGRSPVEQRTFTTRVNRQLGTTTAKDVYSCGRQVRGFHAQA